MSPRHKVIFCLLFIALFCLVLLQPVQAQAIVTQSNSSNGSTFFWRTYVHFKNNKVNAEWIVTQITPEGKYKDVIVINISESCSLISDPNGGGIAIFDHAARFSGGWIQCRLPPFAETVKAYLGIGLGECDCDFSSVTTPFAGARLWRIDADNTVGPVAVWSKMRLMADEKQTILHVDDYAFTSNQVPAVSNTGGSSTFIGLGAAFFLTRIADYNGRDWWLADQDLWEAAQNPAAFIIAWLQGGPAFTAPHQELKYELDPNEQTLYIGFDPETNELLKGVVSNILVDPGCKSRGG